MQALLKRGKPQFLDPSFPEQSAFITDPSRLKLAYCTRRSGKSYADGRYLLKEAYETPSVSCLYLGITRETAENAMWRDVLRRLNRELGLNATPNKTKLELTLPNESTVKLMGMDADEDEARKVLGGKYKLVIADEVAKWRTDLRQLLDMYVRPALADHRGAFVMTSTASDIHHGFFYELTEGHDAQPHRWSKDGFSCHAWNWRQNKYVREKIEEQTASMREVNPRVVETPNYRRMYDPGEWVIDESNLVYAYQRGRNDFEQLPTFHKGSWHYVLAVDLGYEDPCAFTVMAYHDHDRTLYVLESYKRGKLDVTATGNEINAIKQRYDIEHTTIDGSAKQAVEEMNSRHGIMAEAADKKDKAEHVDLMNSDFHAGLIKISPKCGPLREEYGALIWDERALEKRHKRVEHPACDNHATDSCYYGWRHCYQYLATTLKPKPPPINSVEWIQQMNAQQQAEADQHAIDTERRLIEEKRQEREDEQWY
jgi:hypothetical protein